MTDDPNNSDSTPSHTERYTLGHEAGSNVMAQRTAQRRASFLQPYLSAGMNLLDAGCGPGSITVGLAEMVSPGHVTGFDLSEADVERAQNRAKQIGIKNVSFEMASIYEIPYPDNTFDAAFCHGVLEHLNNPVDALAEIRRVLRPGGVVGVAMSDFSGLLVAPDDPIRQKSLDVWHKVKQRNGGNPRAGRHIRRFMREADFSRVEGSSSVIHFAKAPFGQVESKPRKP